MKKCYWVAASVVLMITASVVCISCNENTKGATMTTAVLASGMDSLLIIDTSQIPHDQFGDAVRYGRELMLNTAYYIGPEGTNGRYLGNKMNCTNCHQ
jgi:thiosulfate dehydrogenase